MTRIDPAIAKIGGHTGDLTLNRRYLGLHKRAPRIPTCDPSSCLKIFTTLGNQELSFPEYDL